MMRPLHQAFRPSVSLAVLLASACTSRGPESGNREWIATHDTIGDTIVVHTVSGSVWGDTARLVPEVSIGMLSGPEEYIFGDIVSLAHGPDGTIYVMDRQVPALRVYDPDGSYRTTFGRSGEGPGEYKGPDGGMNVLSDGRVVLRDPPNARIQVFSPEGDALDTWRIRGNFNSSRRMVVDSADRSYVLILLDPEANVLDWKTGLVQINPDGTSGDTLEIPDTPWEEPVIEASRDDGEGNTSVSVNTIPFGPQEHAVLSPRGFFIHGITLSYALTLLKGDAPDIRIEKDYTPVPVTGGERAEEEAQTIRSMRYTEPNWRWNGPEIPEAKPPYQRFYAGEDGTIWVRLHLPGIRVEDLSYDPADPDAIPEEWQEPVLFDVFDADGSYLGAVQAPDGLAMYPQPIFTRDWVLGIVQDEFDVQTVVKFRVDLSEAAATAG